MHRAHTAQLTTCPTPSPDNRSLNDTELWHYRKTPRHRLITNVTDTDVNMGFKECVRNWGRETLENIRLNAPPPQKKSKYHRQVVRLVRRWLYGARDVLHGCTELGIPLNRLSWINQCATLGWKGNRRGYCQLHAVVVTNKANHGTNMISPT